VPVFAHSPTLGGGGQPLGDVPVFAHRWNVLKNVQLGTRLFRPPQKRAETGTSPKGSRPKGIVPKGTKGIKWIKPRRITMNPTNPTKFTFAIIPFKFSCDFIDFGRNALASGMWHEEASDYSRMYKHIHISVDPDNPNRSILEYKAVLSPEKSAELGFAVSDTVRYILTGKNQIGEVYTETVLIPEIKMSIFETKIGFLSCNFVFDEDIDFESLCELTCLIKKMRFSRDNQKNKSLTMRHEGRETCINLLEIIQKMVNHTSGNDHNTIPAADFFFERSDVKNRVSAFMLSSYLFDGEIDEDEAAKYLKPLKRAQSKAHEVRFTREYEKPRILRPFKNMFWGFSSQGAANINYVTGEMSNEAFIRSLYQTIKREYLFMTVFLLNQAYTLIDYCQAFSTVADRAVSEEEMQRMHNFRLRHVYNTTSNLEHYREFYRRLRESLAIDNLMEEVEGKQASLYRQKEDLRNEQLKAIENKIFAVTTIFTVLLGVLGIISNMSEGYFLLVEIGWKNFILLFLAISAGVTLMILVILNVYYMTKSRNK